MIVVMKNKYSNTEQIRNFYLLNCSKKVIFKVKIYETFYLAVKIVILFSG